MDANFLISLWPAIPLFLITKVLVKNNAKTILTTFILMLIYVLYRENQRRNQPFQYEGHHPHYYYGHGPDTDSDEEWEGELEGPLWEDPPPLNIYEQFALNTGVVQPGLLNLPVATDVRGVWVAPED